ncbi:MAG: helix-turn-helix domain-containing protein [Lachnospiraceae bacterium]|nr:helix-turn-helix domain-containing protein [Lachnospiraceae bacterium]
MSRKSKINPVEKVKVVERYLKERIGLNEAARISGNCSNDTIIAWIRIYEESGPAGLLDQPKNQMYSKELKLNAVQDYINGEGSQNDICKKYQIRSRSQLRQWVKVYNNGGNLRETTGGASMKKTRDTTFEERLEIVEECLENDKNYGAAAIKYGCSYQQVRNWVKKYEEMGAAGLDDRRGRRIGSRPSRTPEEELRDKIAELERRNKNLQMENDLLKKVRELGRGEHYH